MSVVFEVKIVINWSSTLEKHKTLESLIRVFFMHFLKKLHFLDFSNSSEAYAKIVECTSSLQCYSVLSDSLVKNELCIPLERGSMLYLLVKVSFAYLHTVSGDGFICLSPYSKLKIAVLFCSIYEIQFRSVL